MSEKKFQDIKIRSYNFSLSIIRFLDSINIKSIFFPLINQVLKSSTSIGANIIEAKSSHSKKDFIKFYEIALKSANETEYWICILRDGVRLDKVKLNKLLNEVDEILKIIATIVIKLKVTRANIIKEKYVKYGLDVYDEFITNLKEQYED